VHVGHHPCRQWVFVGVDEDGADAFGFIDGATAMAATE
jgi:hypothetical protein